MFWIAVLFVPVGVGPTKPDHLAWLTVQVPFNQMDMPICPLKSQIAGSTGHPDLCALCGVLWSAAALQRRPPAAPAAGCAALAPRVSFIPGNFPVLWATKIGLEMQH